MDGYRNLPTGFGRRNQFFIFKIVFSLILAVFAGWPAFAIDANTVAESEEAPANRWQGPVLWFNPEAGGMYLLLAEKATQQLHLYYYSDRYTRLKTYTCVTGQNDGKKQKEKDKKTPEGIYFNDRTFRDNKITIFGDRAFGLNYPDPYDRIEQNGGFGIFMHGSNRKLRPYSTQGCLTLSNRELHELDAYIKPGLTPVIIGESLPFQFSPPQPGWEKLRPFFRKAMRPEKKTKKIQSVRVVAVLGYPQRVVAIGEVRLEKVEQPVIARLYMVQVDDAPLILIDREWESAESFKKKSTPPKKNR